MIPAKVVRHYDISESALRRVDPRRDFAQGWAEIEAVEAEKTRWVRRERIRRTCAANRFWISVEPYITGALMGIAGVMMLLALIAWVSQGGL